MAVDVKTALEQIDAVRTRIAEIHSKRSTAEVAEVTTRICATIDRLAPPGSQYLEMMKRSFVHSKPPFGIGEAEKTYFILTGILDALREDWAAGRLQSFGAIVAAGIFSDFLEQAEYLTGEGYKDAAAVLAGGVLEQHIRELCHKHSIATTYPDPKNGKDVPLKLDRLNGDLAKANAYLRNDQKQVTAWADIRNDAAHGSFSNYSADQVKLMLQGIRDFITRNPS